MNKADLLKYLESQPAKIEAKTFDLEAWKESVANALDVSFGKGNLFSKQILQLDYLTKVDIEDLYPKKVPDIWASKNRFKQVVKETSDQINLLAGDSLESLQQNANQTGVETLKAVKDALSNHLTGKQMKELQQIASSLKNADPKDLIQALRVYDVEVLQNILAEILASKEIWKEG